MISIKNILSFLLFGERLNRCQHFNYPAVKFSQLLHIYMVRHQQKNLQRLFARTKEAAEVTGSNMSFDLNQQQLPSSEVNSFSQMFRELQHVGSHVENAFFLIYVLPYFTHVQQFNVFNRQPVSSLQRKSSNLNPAGL